MFFFTFDTQVLPETALDKKIDRQLRDIWDSGEYEHYREEITRINSLFKKNMGPHKEGLSANNTELEAKTNQFLKLKRVINDRSYVIRLALAILATLIAAFVVTWNHTGLEYRFLNTAVKNTQPIIFAEIVILLATLGMWLRVRIRHTRLKTVFRENEISLSADRRALEAEVRAKSLDEFTRAVNSVFMAQGATAFPIRAPRLVELVDSKIVPSRTFHSVLEFMNDHDSSTIGLSGPRGSGKSTILGNLEYDANAAPGGTTKNQFDASVFIRTPVQHNSKDFMRQILRHCAMEIYRYHGGQHKFLAEKQSDKFRIQRLLLVTWLFMVIILTGYLLFVDTPSASKVLDTSTSERVLTWVQRAFVAFVIPSALIILLSQAMLLPLRFNTKQVSASAKTAIDALEMLEFQTEYSNKSSNRVSLLSRLLSTNDESGSIRSHRDPTQYDLTQNIRELLTLFSNEGHSIALIIDELDKISNIEDLVNLINSLKDIFHIRGCHVLVSVSDEALRNFEQRGLNRKDAFDSSFDTIIGMEALSWKESYDVIQSRVTGFPENISAFCHIWSGGMPRDLLRTARSCVQEQKRAGRALSSIEIMRRVTFLEIEAILKGLQRSHEIPHNELKIIGRWSEKSQNEMLKTISKLPFVHFSDATLRFIGLCKSAEEIFSIFENVNLGESFLGATSPPTARIEKLAKITFLIRTSSSAETPIKNYPWTYSI